jgi:nicotinamide-nucleotide adenylyltransferase
MARDAVLEELKTEQGKGAVRLLLLLAIQNADKAVKPAAFEHRLAMMWAFARDVRKSIDQAGPSDEDGADVAIDVGLTTQPYFHEKSTAIAQSDFYKAHGEGGKVDTESNVPEQVILVGYDTLIRILDPKYYGEPSEDGAPIRKSLDPFFKRAKLRVTMRTDDDWGNKDEQTSYLDSLLKGDGLEKIGGNKEWAGRIEIVDGRKEGEPVVSSTLAREAAKSQNWDRLQELVPAEVKKWIESQKLYAEDA